MRHRAHSVAAAVLASLVLVLAACGGKGDDSGGSAQSGDVKVGPGVTADKIRLGVLTDLTGVFAALGANVTQGIQVYWREKNAAGGVCGRQVELDIKDHGYDPQRAVSIYRQIAPQVLAMQGMLGSPITTALGPTVERDKMLTSATTWASNLLANPWMVVTGSTYDVETINAIDFLMREEGLKSGDSVGHVYFEGELGENALLGSKYAAQQNNLKLVEQRIKATDTDMSSPVAALRRAGVDAIVVSAAPRQTAGVAGVAKSVGLDVPIITNSPGFAPQLLATPAGDAMVENLYNATAFAPFAADKPAVQKVATAYKAQFPKGTPTALVIYGYGEAATFGAILDKACEGEDLSRDGLQTALRSLTSVDTGGVIVPQDFSEQGQPASRMSYVSKASRDAEGGLELVEDAFASEAAESYQVGGAEGS